MCLFNEESVLQPECKTQLVLMSISLQVQRPEGYLVSTFPQYLRINILFHEDCLGGRIVCIHVGIVIIQSHLCWHQLGAFVNKSYQPQVKRSHVFFNYSRSATY